MHERRIPEWLRHAPAPSVRGFAVLAGTEAIARGILISVFPVVIYNALKDARLVSEVYFVIGAISLLIGLLVPYLIPVRPKALGLRLRLGPVRRRRSGDDPRDARGG